MEEGGLADGSWPRGPGMVVRLIPLDQPPAIPSSLPGWEQGASRAM